MPKLGYYTQGDWNATCDECGRGFKFSQLVMRWDMAWVCTTGTCWEPRQPQDFLRSVKDDPSVPIARPRQLPTTIPLVWSSNVVNPLPWYNSNGFLILWTLQ